MEPYWNVNWKKIRVVESMDMVLMEPYWNVNQFVRVAMQQEKLPVLMEPYWNVNILDYPFKTKPFPVLMEPYWNVNFYICEPAYQTDQY